MRKPGSRDKVFQRQCSLLLVMWVTPNQLYRLTQSSKHVGTELDVIAADLYDQPSCLCADVAGRQVIQRVGNDISLATLARTAAASGNGLIRIPQYHILHQVVV